GVVVGSFSTQFHVFSIHLTGRTRQVRDSESSMLRLSRTPAVGRRSPFEGEHMQITGQGALITGGASGLGLATARRLAAAGAQVTIIDLPSSAGEEIAAELGGVFAPADVTSADQVAAAVASAQAIAPLRVVVNCAGIAPPAKVLDRDGSPTDLDAFERIIRINLVGTFN